MENSRSLDDPRHRQWLDDEVSRLLAFGRSVVNEGGGAVSLDELGARRLDQPIETWITSRMVHVYGLGMLLGMPDAAPLATGSMKGLMGLLADDEYGGWYSRVEADGTPLPGIQVISGQKGEPRSKERTGSGHQHQLGNRQNCSLDDPESRRPWRLRLFRWTAGSMKVPWFRSENLIPAFCTSW